MLAPEDEGAEPASASESPVPEPPEPAVAIATLGPELPLVAGADAAVVGGGVGLSPDPPSLCPDPTFGSALDAVAATLEVAGASVLGAEVGTEETTDVRMGRGVAEVASPSGSSAPVIDAAPTTNASVAKEPRMLRREMACIQLPPANLTSCLFAPLELKSSAGEPFSRGPRRCLAY